MFTLKFDYFKSISKVHFASIILSIEDNFILKTQIRELEQEQF